MSPLDNGSFALRASRFALRCTFALSLPVPILLFFIVIVMSRHRHLYQRAFRAARRRAARVASLM